MDHEQQNTPPEKENSAAAIRKQLETEPRFQDFFKDYESKSVEEFIQQYGWKKEMWAENGAYYVQRQEANDMRWYYKCLHIVSLIKQKQLFDLQCRWRAGEMELPGMEICFDFNLWSHNIMKLDFLPPVEELDIEMYLNFLGGNPDPYTGHMFENWQNYDGFRAEYLGIEDWYTADMPDWYEYHNGVTGNGSLFLLPDVRGEREDFYRKLAVEEMQENAAAEAAKNPEPKPEKLPSMMNHLPYVNPAEEHDLVKELMAEFEPPEMLDYYKEVVKQEKKKYDKRDLEPLLDMFLDAGEPIIMQPYADWQESFRNAALKFRVKRISQYFAGGFR